MKTDRKQIFVVDDHPLIRTSLCDAIRTQTDMEVCGEASSLKEALAMLPVSSPDAVVLDLNLTDGTGWTLIEQLSAINQLPPTLVLSVNDESLYAHRLIRHGARGYLMKDRPISDVLASIRKVLAGHIAVSDAVATRLIEHSENETTTMEQAMQMLSDRELQVLNMLAEGLGNKDIGARLKISAKTISTYKTRLMQKMGVRTTPQLMALAVVSQAKPPLQNS